MIRLKEKLQNNELTIGSWITIGNTYVAEIMAQAGFDWLTIDMEHSAITFAEAQQMIQTIELSDCVPLVRVGANDEMIIKRVMDAGAHGVIVPMVNSAQDAKCAVSAVKYPPVGTRGVGLGRAQKYGYGFDAYKEWVDRESVVIVQIEHIDAVRHIEEILTVDGVDGFIIGPYDLSGSLGDPGNFESAQMMAALEEVDRASERLNVAKGYHSVPIDIEKAKDKIASGYTFLAVGVDEMFLGSACRTITSGLGKLARS